MAATQQQERESKGLRAGAIGLVGSIVIGIASTAPAYSLAASLGYVVIVKNGDGIVGTKAPLIMVLAFIPMYFIAVAYSELNKAEPDCGTTFTWAARAFGTRTGWMGGWGIIAADVIVMANLSQIAGTYTFSLFGLDDLAASKFWSTVAGIIWIAVMTYICYRGIEVSVRLQYALLGLELVTLVAFALFALVKVYSGDAPAGIKPSLSWLSPSGLSGTAIVTATLIAVFIYWGWDTAVATNEEADDPSTTPGKAAVLSTVLLLLIYALVSVATIAYAGVGTTGIGLGNVDNADDVFAAMGHEVFGGGSVGWIMVHLLAICVLTSASASTQTTILPTARTSLSMAAFKAIPSRFARIHPRYLTPTDSTIWMGGVSIIFYVGLTLISDDILADTIAAVGLMIAFYYGLTGFACVWFYRKTMWDKPRDILMQGVLPILGGHPARRVLHQGLLHLRRSRLRLHQHRQYRGRVPDRGRVPGARPGADVRLPGDRPGVLPRRDVAQARLGRSRHGRRRGAPGRRTTSGQPRADGDRTRPLQPAARPGGDRPGHRRTHPPTGRPGRGLRCRCPARPARDPR